MPAVAERINPPAINCAITIAPQIQSNRSWTTVATMQATSASRMVAVTEANQAPTWSTESWSTRRL